MNTKMKKKLKQYNLVIIYYVLYIERQCVICYQKVDKYSLWPYAPSLPPTKKPTVSTKSDLLFSTPSSVMTFIIFPES